MADLAADILAATAHPTDTARAVMRLSLVDWLAVGRAGRDEPVARMTRALIEDEAGAPQATLFGQGRAPARGAALVNGATSHALDYDDTHFAHIGHPSVAVIPAALAIAERQGAGKATMLDAALQGCEASIRFGMALGRGHYQVGFHQTATAGALGAAVAAGRLLGLDSERMGHALGLVSTRASGLKSQFGTMGKPYNAGIAAANGVEAALLAAQGFISNPAAIDGPLGFLPTHHADGDARQPAGWLMESVSHKFHACCHGLHATLEALAMLKPLDPDRIGAITIRTHPRWLSVCNQPEPRTGLEAKFSYRVVIALTLLGHDTAALTTYDAALCADPHVIALRDRVRVEPDDTLPETAAHVHIEAGDDAHDAGYDLDAPLPFETRSLRIRQKAAALLGEPAAHTAWEAVHSPHDNLATLTACL